MFYRYHDSPAGRLLLAGDEVGLRMLNKIGRAHV